MIPADNLRKYQCKQADGTWVDCLLNQIEAGDVVRAFEPNGELVNWSRPEDTTVVHEVTVENNYITYILDTPPI